MYNPYSLEGKTILITGASSGIGRATAVECSKLGATLVLTGRDEKALLETKGLLVNPQMQHQLFVADLTSEDDINKLIDNISDIDGLVNNAGIAGKKKPIKFINAEDLNTVLQINTISPILFTQKLLKKKRIKSGASIVFTSSIAGVYLASPGNSLYAISKNAINAFMKGVALEMAVKNIRCNSVNPGTVNTPLINGGYVSEEDRCKDKESYPLKRYGEPEEVAYAIIYLLSDAAKWVTGTNLVIDGGRSLK